jgi:hypothetical protein
VHSVEEYHFRLYDALLPARSLGEALGFDRAIAFTIVNGALFALGLACYAFAVRPGRKAGRPIAWAWAILEALNACAHFALAAAAGGYFPGLWTAPLLLVLGAALMAQLARLTTNRAESTTS